MPAHQFDELAAVFGFDLEFDNDHDLVHRRSDSDDLRRLAHNPTDRRLARELDAVKETPGIGVTSNRSLSRGPRLCRVAEPTENAEAEVVPLYVARIEDLGPGDLVKVDCAGCCQPQAAARAGSHMTRRWREADSNHRSRFRCSSVIEIASCRLRGPLPLRENENHPSPQSKTVRSVAAQKTRDLSLFPNLPKPSPTCHMYRLTC